MKAFIASHRVNIYLKSGEVFVSRKPALVSTVLGSCVAVTMFSVSCGFGAICHAMLTENTGRENDLRYDTALWHLYRCLVAHGVGNDLVVKLFGGARVLDVGDSSSSNLTIGEQNVAKADEVLGALGLTITARDTGGMHGRKLFCARVAGMSTCGGYEVEKTMNEDAAI
ncbi:MAG: chemotaxis protein CheD [Desulfuromonadaceae bacterium]|nr:chemotaxis protein CheD [Desulfuromonadaceae bacterium]